MKYKKSSGLLFRHLLFISRTRTFLKCFALHFADNTYEGFFVFERHIRMSIWGPSSMAAPTDPRRMTVTTATIARCLMLLVANMRV